MQTWNDLTDPTGYQRRKQSRKDHYENHVKGKKLKTCVACNGSGYYDITIKGRVPRCSSCDGKGKTV